MWVVNFSHIRMKIFSFFFHLIIDGRYFEREPETRTFDLCWLVSSTRISHKRSGHDEAVILQDINHRIFSLFLVAIARPPKSLALRTKFNNSQAIKKPFHRDGVCLRKSVSLYFDCQNVSARFAFSSMRMYQSCLSGCHKNFINIERSMRKRWKRRWSDGDLDTGGYDVRYVFGDVAKLEAKCSWHDIENMSIRLML